MHGQMCTSHHYQVGLAVRHAVCAVCVCVSPYALLLQTVMLAGMVMALVPATMLLFFDDDQVRAPAQRCTAWAGRPSLDLASPPSLESCACGSVMYMYMVACAQLLVIVDGACDLRRQVAPMHLARMAW